MEISSSGGSLDAPGQANKLIRFGDFEFRADLQELRKCGVPIKIQPKPLSVLRALIEHPGELVTRETLARHLWPEGTFVDFESGLNTATNRLRSALGDSAERPMYIQTVSRVGYRLICPVETAGVEKPETQPQLDLPSKPESQPRLANPGVQHVFLSKLKALASWPKSYLVLLLLAVVLVFVILAHSRGLVSWSQAHFSARYFSWSLRLIKLLTDAHA